MTPTFLTSKFASPLSARRSNGFEARAGSPPGGGGVQRVAVVDGFGPRVDSAQRQAAAEATIQVDLQGVVGTVALRKSRSRCWRWQHWAWLRWEHSKFRPGTDVPAMPAGKVAGISCRTWSGGTDHRKRLVGVDADDFMISVRSDIPDGQSRIGGQFLLDAERPATSAWASSDRAGLRREPAWRSPESARPAGPGVAKPGRLGRL